MYQEDVVSKDTSIHVLIIIQYIKKFIFIPCTAVKSIYHEVFCLMPLTLVLVRQRRRRPQ